MPDRFQAGHPLFGLVWINPERMSGEPCFYGTRVPVQNLFDYVDAGHTIDQFLDDFDGVSPEQAHKIVQLARRHVLDELRKAW